ncbi:MAG TPA: ABC transporter ATP-binding protein [Acetobacteraceae bacterium]
MLSVRALTKIYANRFDGQAGGVRDVSFELPTGTFFTLLGPSGCGKTTTLRCIAGLERPDSGRIAVGDRVLFDQELRFGVPMNQRGIGMVFQSYAIWPHMTVFENIAFPLRVAKDRRHGREEIRKLVDEALRTVGLVGYGERPATRLSGGQQQRVALARALVHRPQLLLLDEPLSNLDAALREEMRVELRRLQQQIGVTTIYVTHDQNEALAMSDRIAVMEGGRIVQMDEPREIYFRPASGFVASFIGSSNLLTGVCPAGARAGEVAAVRLPDNSTIQCLFAAAHAGGGTVSVSVRPEAIALLAADAAPLNGENRLRGTVTAASFQGSNVRYDIRSGDLVVRVVGPAEPVFAPETDLLMTFAPRSAIALPS